MPGAKVTIKDNSRKFRKEFEQVIRRRLLKVGEMVRGRVVKVLGEHHSRDEGPSAPGDPPGIDTGMLRKSIEHSIGDDGQSVSIGTTLDYGRWLEEGTEHMSARPYLAPTAEESAADAAAILTAPIPPGSLGQ